MIFFYIAIILAIFFNGSLSVFIGIKETFIFSYTPLLYLTFSNFLSRNVNNNNKFLRFFYFSFFLFISIIIFSFFNINIETKSKFYLFKNSFGLLILPPLVILYFTNVHIIKIKALEYIVILFFLIETLIAIIERIYLRHLFYFNMSDNTISQNSDFRSRSLMGDPLNNSMLITTLLSFIVISKKISINNKIIYFFLGYFSLFSFNSRWAILISTFIILPFLIYTIFNKSMINKNKNYYLSFLFIISIFTIYLLLNTNIGGRLVYNDILYDESAKTRVEIFQFYYFIDFWDLYFGNPDNVNILISKFNAAAIENGIISFIINYGIIFTIPILIFIVILQNNILIYLNKYEKYFIFIIYYIFGITSPNLLNPQQFLLFIFSYFALIYKKKPNFS